MAEKLKEDEISYVEIVLTNGLHMRILPRTKEAQTWTEHDGFLMHFATMNLSTLISMMEKVSENKRRERERQSTDR